MLTPCYGDGINPGTADHPYHSSHENLDPTKEFTYEFMRDLFSEIANVTKDSYIHLGLDEVGLISDFVFVAYVNYFCFPYL